MSECPVLQAALMPNKAHWRALIDSKRRHLNLLISSISVSQNATITICTVSFSPAMRRCLREIDVSLG